MIISSKTRAGEKSPVRVFSYSKFLEKPANKIKEAYPDARQQSKGDEYEPGDDELKFFISILIRRRKLILRKIWRWSV